MLASNRMALTGRAGEASGGRGLSGLNSPAGIRSTSSRSSLIRTILIAFRLARLPRARYIPSVEKNPMIRQTDSPALALLGLLLR
jgi:hypothetical protein